MDICTTTLQELRAEISRLQNPCRGTPGRGHHCWQRIRPARNLERANLLLKIEVAERKSAE
ncbi:MAG: hypothetical protein KKB70_07700 [Proteobacteria bacterium]|nr:hypothetical protein [Pseudomonadota bacterium]